MAILISCRAEARIFRVEQAKGENKIGQTNRKGSDHDKGCNTHIFHALVVKYVTNRNRHFLVSKVT